MKSKPPGAVALLMLCVAGVAVAALLATMHYALLFGDLSFGAVCGARGGCVQVIASRYGQWAGLPVGLWGLWFYLVAAALVLALMLLPSDEAPGYARALWWLALLAVLADLHLGWMMAAHVGRLCILCVITYVINLAVLALTLRMLVRLRIAAIGALPSPDASAEAPPAPPSPDRGRLVRLALTVATIASVAVTLGTALAVSSAAERKERANRAGLLAYLKSAPPAGLPDGTAPRRGPDQASVTLVTFSDFLCEQCRELSRYLEIVAANHRDSLRIIHRHLPLDADCNPNAVSSPHPGACVLARAAECARRQGRFWAFHDAAFADEHGPSPERIERYAALAGLDLSELRSCMDDPSSLGQVRRDIALAESLGVHSTPTTFINGRAVVGAFKPWLWEDAIRAVTSSSLAHTGTDRDSSMSRDGAGARAERRLSATARGY